MLHFAYPAFLFGLLALAIPVIIHLFHFRRVQKVYFSNVQFLKEVNEQESGRRNLKERLILLARLLAIFFLVLAFARPYFADRGTPQVTGQTQVVSIFLDNSYSMQALSREGTLLDEAKTTAKTIADRYDLNTKFQLLTQDFEGKHQRFLSRSEFKDAVDGVKISAQSRALQAIVNRQQSLLQTQPAAAKSIYLISDFQKSNAETPVKADPGIFLSSVKLQANTLPNIAVDSVWLINAIHRPGEPEKLVVRLHNYAGARAVNAPLKLLVNNTQKALGSYTINAGAVQTDTLSFSGLTAGWQQAEINLQDNPITFDNRFYFSFNVQNQLPVLMVTQSAPDVYLKAVFSSDPFFKLTETTDGHVDYNGLGQYSLVVLSNIKSISAGLSKQLQAYVAKGGSLSVFPAADIDAGSYQSLLSSVNAAYPQQLIKEDSRVGSLNNKAAVYRNTFESMPQNPDLPVVKAYYRLNEAGTSAAEKLMSLNNGQSFWSRYSYKQGNVYLCSSPLDESFSNLPRHALFVTTMLRIALLSGHDQPLYHQLSTDQSIEIPDFETGADDVLMLQQGDLKVVPDVRRQEGASYLFVSDQLNKPGQYALQRGSQFLQWLSFNSQSGESDLHYFTKKELQQLLPGGARIMGEAEASAKVAANGINSGSQIWKLCLLLTLIFLAAEIALIRFYKTNKKGTADQQTIINTGTNQYS
ncbi:BatA domain-containing protein [Mucilaginibacter sp. RS28]|uniref:BatA domain-containing protein n=1 Tax=Mucilaginibacter straminoryzae TaxID=2932774 RepID=A0A9X1X5Z2_9SPHI|nr:BatA domain-containing protein [Mucilaginibacter straminoryzae]MCJ8211176.1 BatA domain-containing protein [Mucilaginibacter straminoryzae]